MVKKLIVHLLGAISSGKGHVCRLLENELGENVSIIGLGTLVRTRLDIDRDFKSAYGPWIDRGWLLPDEVVCPMLNASLQGPLNPIVVIEGFDRTVEQLYWSHQKGLMGQNSIFYRLDATRKTCLDRHKHRNASKPDGIRTDTSHESFTEKYSSFIGSIDEINKTITRLKSRVVSISADGDIPKDVFPVIHSHILGLACPASPHIIGQSAYAPDHQPQMVGASA